ncbi:MAG TPA: DUF3267 domain-containing protein [Anaerolineales bacterium]|nr:DUF3267 domain-containing protein [Anaerolineales bacterium]
MHAPKPTKMLPRGFVPRRQLDLTKNHRATLLLNLVAILSFFLYGWLFFAIADWIRSDLDSLNEVAGASFWQLMATFLLVLVLHELIHGLFFSVFTGEAPRLGVRGLYAFAGAPDWYIPRQQYLVIGLAPFVLMSLGGLSALIFVPLPVVPLILFAITLNAAGASGDIFITGWLLGEPDLLLVNDTGEIFTMFAPETS